VARLGMVGMEGLVVIERATSLLKGVARVVSGAVLLAIGLYGTVRAEAAITIRLSSAQNYCFVADLAIACVDLGTRLLAMQVPVDSHIHLSVDADARYEMTVSALQSLHKAGYQQVGFMTESALPEITELADAIARARSLPPGSAGKTLCPAHLEKLVGLTAHGLSEGLGKPDFVERGDGDDATEGQLRWSYFLTGPSKHTAKVEDNTVTVSAGGGYPVVTLHFGASKTVVRAECTLAR
jgi:hypothetical protein